MNIYHLDPNGLQELETAVAPPEGGLLWLDCQRGEDRDWPALLERLTGTVVHERHLHDSLNEGHASFYDFTSDYDMIIFRGAVASDLAEGFSSRAVAFFLTRQVLVTVQCGRSRSIAAIREFLGRRGTRPPAEPIALMHLIINNMVDNLLALREPFIEQMQQHTDRLFESRQRNDDWRGLLAFGRQLRQLDMLVEEQETAVLAWRDINAESLTEPLRIRFTDLIEHIRRVGRFAEQQHHELDSLLQLHFSAVAHRTNSIVHVLTLLSAIFLPLTLIAGIYGMNFQNMPELHTRYGYFVTLGVMAALALVMAVLFRRKRWW